MQEQAEKGWVRWPVSQSQHVAEVGLDLSTASRALSRPRTPGFSALGALYQHPEEKPKGLVAFLEKLTSGGSETPKRGPSRTMQPFQISATLAQC